MGQLGSYGTKQKKSSHRFNDNCLFYTKLMVRPTRFERVTAWFVDSCSLVKYLSNIIRSGFLFVPLTRLVWLIETLDLTNIMLMLWDKLLQRQ